MSWHDVRQTLDSAITGLGLAKSSFFLTLLHPMEAQVVCLDSHMLRVFGWTEKVWGSILDHSKHYFAMELEVLSQCSKMKVQAVAAREVLWTHLRLTARGEGHMEISMSMREWVEPLMQCCASK